MQNPACLTASCASTSDTRTTSWRRACRRRSRRSWGWANDRHGLPTRRAVRILVRDHIGKDETVALDGFANTDGNFVAEHRTSRDRRMKLTVLSARIDTFRQVTQQIGVEPPPAKTAIEFARIEADDACRKTPGDHFAREFGGIAVPQREDRFDPGT